MKNYLTCFVMLMMIIMGSMSISSCSNDDNVSTSTSIQNNKLVGKWKYADGDDFVIILTFNSNGTGTFYEKEEGDVDTGDFYYTYNNDTNLLELIFEDEDGDVEVERIVLKWINDSTIVFDNELILKKQ